MIGRPKADNPKIVTIKARINHDINEKLMEYCSQSGLKKTDIIRKGVELFMNREKIYTVHIQHDYQTSERVGAGGMFQVVAASGCNANDEKIKFSKIDCGVHYRSNENVLDDLKELYPEFDFSSCDLVDDD